MSNEITPALRAALLTCAKDRVFGAKCAKRIALKLQKMGLGVARLSGDHGAGFAQQGAYYLTVSREGAELLGLRSAAQYRPMANMAAGPNVGLGMGQ